MSMKRARYHPVQQEVVPTKDKRKTLAQGRLTTDSVTESTGPTDLLSSIGTIQGSPVLRLHDIDVPNYVEPSTPRKATPRKSPVDSPRRMQPHSSLELTDSERGAPVYSPIRGTMRKQQPAVMVVDASRQTAGPESSEVDISLGFTRSPARVVCHSPSVIPGSIGDETGSVARNRRIKMDELPTVFIANEGSALEKDRADTSPPRHKSPAVIREKAVLGGHHQQMSSHHDHSSSLESADTCMSDVSSVSDISPLEPKRTNPPATKLSVVITENLQDKKKTKKRAAKVVSSRYMSTSSSKPAPVKVVANKSKDSSVNFSEFRPKGRNDSRELQPIRTAGSVRREPVKARTGSGTRLGHRDRSGTRLTGSRGRPEEIRSIATDGGKSRLDRSRDVEEIRRIRTAGATVTGGSTRKAGESVTDIGNISSEMHPKTLSFMDSTGISAANRSDDNFTSHILDLSEIPSVGHSHQRQLSREVRSKQKSKPMDKQLKLDLLYSRYLQFVFLNSKAKKNFQEQEKSAMTQIYGLWEENERLRQRDADLKQQLAKLKHLNKVDDALHQQLTSLGSVVPSLDQLTTEYKRLAEALDTTRHQIQTKGIYIPDDQDHYQELMVKALQESEQLLGELSVMFRQQEPKIKDFSDNMIAMEKTLENEVLALSNCKEVMSAAESWAMNEASLRVQDLQLTSR